jgi:hypothetical protein
MCASYALAQYQRLFRRVLIQGASIGQPDAASACIPRRSGAGSGGLARHAQTLSLRRGTGPGRGGGTPCGLTRDGWWGRNGITRQDSDGGRGGDAAAQGKPGKHNGRKRYGKTHGFTPQGSLQKLDHKKWKSSLVSMLRFFTETRSSVRIEGAFLWLTRGKLHRKGSSGRA